MWRNRVAQGVGRNGLAKDGSGGLACCKSLNNPCRSDIAIMPTAAKEVIISNSLGLHARPAMQFVDLANQFTATIKVYKRCSDPCEVDGKSVMQMITLEAAAGTQLEICAEGDDADTAVQRLAALVDSKFGEE